MLKKIVNLEIFGRSSRAANANKTAAKREIDRKKSGLSMSEFIESKKAATKQAQAAAKAQRTAEKPAAVKAKAAEKAAATPAKAK